MSFLLSIFCMISDHRWRRRTRYVMRCTRCGRARYSFDAEYKQPW